MVPALDIALSSLTFAKGLLGGQQIGTFSVSGSTTPQNFSFSLAQGTGDTDNNRFQVQGDRLEIQPGQFFQANATYSILVQATGTSGALTQKNIQLMAKPDLVVTLGGDVVDPNDGGVSLREAIAMANAGPDHDRIVFDPALPVDKIMVSTVGSTVEGPSAFLVSTAISIDGARPLSPSAQQGSGNFSAIGDRHTGIARPGTAPEMRLFTVSPSGSLRLEKIDLEGGLALGDDQLHPNGRGGAILARGPLALFYASVSNSTAVGFSGLFPGKAQGGAIYSEAGLQLFQSTVSGNSAVGGTGASQNATGEGGGVFVEISGPGQRFLQLDSVTIANNTATAGAGIAILPPSGTVGGASLAVNFQNSVLADNTGGFDADILPGASSTVTVSVSGTFAESVGSSLANGGFQTGDPSLGPAESFHGSRIHRPLAGSPLIGAVTSQVNFTDQTGVQRLFPSAAGAAEYYAPPSDIILDNPYFPASIPVGVEIGKLFASGNGAGFSFSLALVPGALNNDRFEIRDNLLLTAPGYTHTPGATYVIRVRATGATGLTFNKDISLFAKPDIIVDTAADSINATDGKTSLREALVIAKQTPGFDQIAFDQVLSHSAIELDEDANFPGSALFIDSNVVVTGEFAPGVTLKPIPGKNIRIFQSGFGFALGLKSLTITGGRAVDGRGGAILADGADLFIDGVTFSDNSSSGAGAAGGAISATNSQVEIRNSTFSNNRVEAATGQLIGTGEGGHMFFFTQGSGGSFTGGGTGGGTGSPGDGGIGGGTGGGTIGGGTAAGGPIPPVVTIVGSTFAGGLATGTVGGVTLRSGRLFSSPVAQISGSVFADSTGTDLTFVTTSGAQPFSAMGGGNFAESASGLPAGFQPATGDAKLGTLANNGGAAFTIAPQQGSPLFMGVNPVADLPTDQRGVTRSAPFTIGAYQVVLATGSSVQASASPRGIGATVDFTVTFSQPVSVTGSPALNLGITGAKAFAITPSQASSAIVFRYTVAAGDVSPGITTGGPMALDFAGGKIIDSAGGAVLTGVPAPTPSGPAIDGIAPSGFLGFASPLPSNPSKAGSYGAFASFGETGLGPLDPSDFQLSNATVGSISGPDASGKYTFTVSPVADGPVTVSLKAGALVDAAGNPSLATQALTIMSDRTGPAPVVSLTPAPGAASSAPQFGGVVAFGETVLGPLDPSGFQLANATIVGPISGPDATGRYTFTLSPISDGTVFVSVVPGAVADAAGNPSKASNVVSFMSDRTGPAAMVQSAPALVSLPGGARKISFTVAFSDPSGVKASTVNNSAVSVLGPDETNFTANYPAVLESYVGGVARFGVALGTQPLDGTYFVSLTGTVEDSLGNTSSQVGIGTVTIGMFDEISPELVSVTRASQQNPSFAALQRFVVSFSEPVVGVTAGQFMPVVSTGLDAGVIRVTLPGGAPLTAAPAQVFVVEVSSSGVGTLGLELAGESGITDSAGNPLSFPSETIPMEDYEVDTTPVKVESIGPVSSPRSTPVDTIDIVLSKPLDDTAKLVLALSMERNDRKFPLDAPFTVVRTGYSSYRIENFATQSGVAGNYTLKLNAALLADPAGRPGMGTGSVSWSAVSPLSVTSYNPVFAVPKLNGPDPFVVGVPKRVLLGTFSDATGGLMSDYVARVNWGDSAVSIPFTALENAEVIATATPGVFDVFGTHTYGLDRNHLINVLIRDTASGPGSLLGLAESSSVVVTAGQALNLVQEQFLRGDTTTPILTASLQPTGQARPLLQVLFVQPPAVTGAERTLYLAAYANNPEQANVPIGPASSASFNWLDLRASGVEAQTGSLVTQFAFSAGTGQQVALFYFNSATGAYEPVLSSGGVVPAVDRVSGQAMVTFDDTSTPKLAKLNETVFAVAVSTPVPSTGGTDPSPTVNAGAAVTATFNSTLVQASQTLNQMGGARSAVSDSASGVFSTGLFVGGRASTLALTPSALGSPVPARMRASAGARLALASSKDAAMALGGLLRGAFAPVERKIKPLMEALGLTGGAEESNPPAKPPEGGAKPEEPRGDGAGPGEKKPEGAVSESAPSPEMMIRALDAAMAEGMEDELPALTAGAWALAGTALLALAHVREIRERRKPQGWSGPFTG